MDANITGIILWTLLVTAAAGIITVVGAHISLKRRHVCPHCKKLISRKATACPYCGKGAFVAV